MSEFSVDRLVVAFNFPPFNDGSAVTVAKRIVQAGDCIDGIGANLSSLRDRDDTLLELVQPWIRTQDTVSVPIRFADERSVKPFVTKGLSLLQRRNREPYQNVYSRSMWPHSHFLAASVLVHDFARTWTAEFSDPVLWHADGTPRP